jgi:hypothetical protein
MVLPLMQVRFSDDQHGWIVGFGVILYPRMAEALVFLHRPRMTGQRPLGKFCTRYTAATV